MTIALVMSWRPHWPLCVPCLGRTAVSSCQAGPGLRLHPHCMMTAASASIDLTADSCLAVTAGHSLPLSAPPQTGSCLCPLSESPRGTWSARPSPPPPYLGQEAPPLIAASCHTFDFSPSYSYNQRGATLVCCVAALITLVHWLWSIIIHLAELWHLHTPIVSIMQRLDTDMTSPVTTPGIFVCWDWGIEDTDSITPVHTAPGTNFYSAQTRQTTNSLYRQAKN